jgi:hypothetical protein
VVPILEQISTNQMAAKIVPSDLANHDMKPRAAARHSASKPLEPEESFTMDVRGQELGQGHMADREYWWWYVEDLASLGKAGSTSAPSNIYSHPTSPASTEERIGHLLTPEQLEKIVGRVLSERGRWAPFSCIDRDRIEAEFRAGAGKTAVSAHSGQRLWLADAELLQMSPLYWKGGSVVPLRRSLWMVMPGDPQEDSQGGIPCPLDWEQELEAAVSGQASWLDYDSDTKETEMERSIQLGGVLAGYLLHLRRGIKSMATLVPLPSNPGRQSIIKGILPTVPPKPIRLLRGYTAYYTAMVTAINKPQMTPPSAPAASSMTPPPKTVQIPPSPFESSEVPGPKPVKHIIFVVHGIGQKLAERFGYGFVSAINSLRRYVLTAANGRDLDLEDVYILPIEWRIELDMGSGYFAPHSEDSSAAEFDSLMAAITLPTVPAVRTLATDVTMDVLLYMTPRHFNRIIDSCVNEIRRVHSLFTKYNPGSNDTKISLIGHSLGSALVCDLLGITLDHDTASVAELQSSMLAIQNRLGFPVENFFSFGSPLPLFMLLKHIKPIACVGSVDIESMLDKARLDFTYYQTENYPKMGFLGCKQLYNLFMPYDPVAFRMEPLIVPPSDRADIIEPALVPYRKGGMTGMKLGMTESFNKTKNEVLEAMNRTLPEWVRQRITSPPMNTIIEPSQKEMSASSRLLASFNESGRIDYVLQDSILENAYISSMSSHFSYWADADVAYFLIAQLFK